MAYRVLRGRALAALLFVFVLTSTGTQAAQLCPSDLVSWWPGSGNTLDVIGAHNGVIEGSVGYTGAAVGQGFSLAGGNVRVAHHAELDPAGSFTVHAWVRTTQATGTQVIVAKYECGSYCPSNVANSVYQMTVGLGKLQGYVRDTDVGGPEGGGQSITGARTLSDGALHHVVFVRDVAAPELRLYADGALEAVAPLHPNVGQALKDDDGEADPLRIGAISNPGFAGVNSLFFGTIDEAAFHTTALTTTEIEEIHLNGLAGHCGPDLAPLSLSAPAVAAAGGTVAVDWTVENRGLASADGAWEDAIHLSSDATLDAGDLALGSFTHSVPIPAGSTYDDAAELALPGVGSGAYFLILSADANGAVVEASNRNNDLAISIGIDADAPDTAILAAPSGWVADSQASVSFEATEAGSTFECSVDGGAFAVCSSPATLGPLADGPHAFEVRATDAVGNVDPTPASAAWGVDTVAPLVTLTRPGDAFYVADVEVAASPAGPVVVGNVTVRALVVPGISGVAAFSFLVDGTPVDPGAVAYDAGTGEYSFLYEAEEAGEHVIEAVATGGSGLATSDSVVVLAVPLAGPGSP